MGITRTFSTPAMQSVAVVALALLESVSAFQAPALASKAVHKAASPTMFSEGDIGVLPPLGVYDPLGLIETRDMHRYEIMEIKHGRAAMLGFLHVIALKAGIVLPGALTLSGTVRRHPDFVPRLSRGSADLRLAPDHAVL